MTSTVLLVLDGLHLGATILWLIGGIIQAAEQLYRLSTYRVALRPGLGLENRNGVTAAVKRDSFASVS